MEGSEGSSGRAAKQCTDLLLFFIYFWMLNVKCLGHLLQKTYWQLALDMLKAELALRSHLNVLYLQNCIHTCLNQTPCQALTTNT